MIHVIELLSLRVILSDLFLDHTSLTTTSATEIWFLALYSLTGDLLAYPVDIVVMAAVILVVLRNRSFPIRDH